MIVLKRALLIWSVLALILVGLVIAVIKPQGTHAHTFCAYNRVFVEFEEDGRRWGTIMLDYDGKPVPCKENMEEIPVNTKEII